MPKKITLSEAAGLIQNYSLVFIGGFAHIRACMSFSRELIRQKKHDLHFVSSGPTVHADLLAGAKVINKMEAAYGGIETIGPGPNIRRRVEEGFLQFEDYTNFSMTMRFYGGAMGVPFMPVKSILGSDIELKSTFRKKGSKLEVVECPFTDEYVCLVPSINPDFGVIQAQRVDTEGNVQIDDVEASDVDGLKSADVKIVLAEEIVSPKVTRSDPKRTCVPGLMVDYIVHAPYGAWPTAMYNFYDYDQKHIEFYADICKTEAGLQKYLKEWVLPKEEEILKKIRSAVRK
jgi:acyl CoA:acetate/3-ketoacid CoA transferase alpha subunit